MIEAEITKFFYSLLLERAVEEDEFVQVANRVRDHIFRKDMLYPPNLREYLLELIANQEIKFYKDRTDEDEEDVAKMIRNIQK